MGEIADLIREIQENLRIFDELEHNPPEVVRWSCGQGCSEEDVAALEKRLGTRLPVTYREFLLEVNGCPKLGICDAGLCPVENVEWFRTRHEDWIHAHTDPRESDISEEEHLVYGPDQDAGHYRLAYMKELLQIGAPDVWGTVYLFNPKVKDAKGEWEAWDFADSYPGARRYQSFKAFLERQLHSVKREVYLLRFNVDDEKLLAETLTDLRRVLRDDGLSPKEAVMRFIGANFKSNDALGAWMRRPNGLRDLTRTLEQALEES
jgi:hypothetical protein